MTNTFYSVIKISTSMAFAVAVLFMAQFASAANTISSSTTLDTNGDGYIDTIRWTMDEATASCTFDADDWSVQSPGSSDVSAVTGVNCDGNNINISVTADDLRTGGTLPTIGYDQSAGTADSIVLASGAMTDKVENTDNDGAAPVVAAVTIVNQANVQIGSEGDVGLPSTEPIAVLYQFSEDIDSIDDVALGTEVSLSPSQVGAVASTEGIDGSDAFFYVLATFSCGTTFTLTLDENAIDAASGSPTGLLLTGPENGTFSFTTESCSGSQQSVNVVSPFLNVSQVPAVQVGSRFTVNWEAGGAGLGFVNIYLSEDAGESYKKIASNVNAGLGRYTLTAPEEATTARVKVVATDLVTEILSEETNSFSVVGPVRGSDDVNEDTNEGMDESDEADDLSRDGQIPDGYAPGDAVTSSVSSAVYYITKNGGRMVFADTQTYFTWFDSFDSVKEISISDLNMMPLEGVMLPKAGVVLVKIQSAAAVYALTDDNADLMPELRMIPSEAAAAALYGSDWADYVIDIEPTFFSSFEMGAPYTGSESLDTSSMKKRLNLK